MQYKIDLIGEHTVTKGPRDKSWAASVSIDLATLSADMVAKLAIHGLQQKIADAASGAQTADEAGASMSKAVNAILAGEWSSRTAGEGVDEFTATARAITRNMVKASVGAKSPAWVAFTGLSDAEQAAKLDANYAANETALRPAVEAEIARKQAAREEKRGLAKTTKFSL